MNKLTVEINGTERLTTGLRSGGQLYVVLIDGEDLILALADHRDAEIGEWAVFNGWMAAMENPGLTIAVAAHGKVVNFAYPRRFGNLLIYKRVSKTEAEGIWNHASQDTVG